MSQLFSGINVKNGSAESVPLHIQKFIDSILTGKSDENKAIYRPLLERNCLMRNAPPTVTFDDIDGSIPYIPSQKPIRTSVHIGQRKLFNTEVQFLVDIPPDTRAFCVYAGAAPSNKTGYLAKLFPNVKFILIDPNKFDIFEAKPVYLHKRGDPPIDAARAKKLIYAASDGPIGIYIINDLMTMELAAAIAPLDNVYFISDIRSGEAESFHIIWNLAQQYIWVKTMKPISSMLKFRYPFCHEPEDKIMGMLTSPLMQPVFTIAKTLGIDFIANYKLRRLIYFDGTVNLQTFQGVSSTETRLITDGKKIRDWGTITEYENKFTYYNNIERCYRHRANENADRKLGFDHCNDCAIENMIWKKYINIYKPEDTNVKNYVKKLSQITHRPLIRENHGRFGF